jgi:hypothetical protein
MQVVKGPSLIFLTLLAGCTEPSSGLSRVTGPVSDPIVKTQLVEMQMKF